MMGQVKGLRCALVGIAFTAAVVTTSGAGAAPAVPAADDVALQVCLSGGSPPGCLVNVTTTTQLSFRIIVYALSSAAVIQPVRLTIQRPAGLTWGTQGPTAAEGCTGTNPVVCSKQLERGEAGEATARWLWTVVAARAGTYEIAASLATTEADPNAANNTASLRVSVTPPAPAPSPPATPAVSVGAARVIPLRPKAGSTVSVSVPVRAGSVPVRPIAVRCTAVAGQLKITGTGQATAGTARCIYRTPPAAKGQTLRGKITFGARGLTKQRTFSVRLL